MSATSPTHRGFKWTVGDASNPALALLVDETSQSLHVAVPSDANTDWNVAADSHPSVYIHSNTTPATDYVKIYHDATNGYVDSVGGNLVLAVAGTNEITITASATSPSTTDSNALGTTALMWSDLFLASGAVINFNNGNVTITHAAGVLTVDGAAMVFNEASADLDFRVESNGMAYAIYADGAKDALVLGSNTDTSSADQLITVSRAARTATANTSYYDVAVQPAGAVTVPAGTTAVVASLSINEPNVTATGTVTRAATLHIASQPTEGGTANAAIFFGAAANIACTTSLTFNEDSEDIDFRFESNGMAYAIYSDGAKDALVLGSNTDTSSADQLITVSRAARTATANVNYFDLAIAPAGAVTVPTGTTAVVASVSIAEPNITATGTVTLSAVLYIPSVASEATDDFAIYCVSGPISTGIATATNVTGNVGLFSGGIAMTDVANAWIDDATHGSGTTTHYIGNQTITTSSDKRVKTDIQEWSGEAMAVLRQAESLKEFRYNLPGGGPQDSGYGPNARGKYLGFMAQETLKWAPWVVNAGAGADCQKCLAGEPCEKHTPWHVEYQHLVPLMIQGLKEVDSRLARLGV